MYKIRFDLCKKIFPIKYFVFSDSFLYIAAKLKNMAIKAPVKVQPKTVEEQIVEYMDSKGIKFSWLAETIGVSVGHLHNVLKGEGNVKRELTDENLEKVNEALEKNFKR